MVLYFTGTGNSRYLARRIAEGLDMPLYDLNACIKAGDTAPVQTGRDVVLVTPTYAWRIPRVVSEWLGKTALTGAERIWFVMDCGSEIGNAAKYNRQLAAQKQLQYMGTAQIIMPENYIAMFNACLLYTSRIWWRSAGRVSWTLMCIWASGKNEMTKNAHQCP